MSVSLSPSPATRTPSPPRHNSLSSVLSSALSHSSDSSPSTSTLHVLQSSLQSHKSRLQEKITKLDRQREQLVSGPGLGGAFSSSQQQQPAEEVAPPVVKIATPPLPKSPQSKNESLPITIKKEEQDLSIEGDIDGEPVLPKPKRIKRTHQQQLTDHDDRHDDNEQHSSAATPPPPTTTTTSKTTSPRIPKRTGRHTPAAADQPSSSSSSTEVPARTGRPLGIRLKLNPTRAPTGIAALGAAHRPTGIHPNGLTISPGGLSTANAATTSDFNWSLPDEPTSIIPPPPVSHPPRAYLTDPAQVDEDFTAMDWKERERQRDRDDALLPSLASMSASASPAPGQLHSQKDSVSASAAAAAAAAANRVRSQNQQQVTYQTFQTYVDSWFKTITEEDVAWLGRVEDVSDQRFRLPPLGRHYKDVWAEEDTPTHLSQYPNDLSREQNDMDTPPSKEVAPAFDPRTLSDEHANGTASTEAKGGPLAERVLSMLLPGTNNNVTNGTSTSYPPFPPPPSQDMSAYESGILKELQFLDLLGPNPPTTTTGEDDEISHLLRQVSSQLKTQIQTNESRRHRLRDIAKDRMAYQDYYTCLLHVEKQIENGWYKRQSLLKKLISKKKSNKGSSTASEGSLLKITLDSQTEEVGPSGTTTPLGDPTSSNYLSVPPLNEQLLLAMEKRNQLKRALEPLFESMPHSKYVPLPQESVFEDLEGETVE